LAKIADYYGVSQVELRRANKFQKGAPLKIGMEIEIPHVLRGGALRSHVVEPGDTLAGVSSRYGVTVTALSAANNMSATSPLTIGRTLVVPDPVEEEDRYKPDTSPRAIKSGKVVSNGVRHTVQQGQSLWLIARAYGLSGDALARANGLKPDTTLRPGKSILVPGASKVEPVEASSSNARPISFVRNLTGEQASLTLLNSNGKVIEKSRRTLSELCRAKAGPEKVMLLHRRLVILLQQVADRFPGKRFEIISGFRPYEKGNESKHSLGRAIDFRVIGVSNKDVYNFIKTLPNVGAGYYPHSAFVHLDVRDKTTLWTDSSRVGQKPKYSSKQFGPKKKAK
jgi:LysM repeat protein